MHRRAGDRGPRRPDPLDGQAELVPGITAGIGGLAVSMPVAGLVGTAVVVVTAGTEQSEDEEDGFQREGEGDVELDNADGAAAERDGFGDFAEVVLHERHVGGFDGGVGARTTHRDADRCNSQCRGIIHTIANHGDYIRFLIARPSLEFLHLGRQGGNWVWVHFFFFLGFWVFQ